jgi:hypothetical protein
LKQLDEGIDNTLVSNVRAEVSFSLCDSLEEMNREGPYASRIEAPQ